MSTATNNEMVSLKPIKESNFGDLIVVSAKKLEEEGKTGIVAQGILEKTEPNKYNKPGQDKQDYFVRDGKTLYIIRETQAIKDQLGQPGTLGLWVQVKYNGKVKTKSGTGFHDFECFAKKA